LTCFTEQYIPYLKADSQLFAVIKSKIMVLLKDCYEDELSYDNSDPVLNKQIEELAI